MIKTFKEFSKASKPLRLLQASFVVFKWKPMKIIAINNEITNIIRISFGKL
jgi:hypothetical protein